jgi:uncharacterized membrane protein
MGIFTGLKQGLNNMVQNQLLLLKMEAAEKSAVLVSKLIAALVVLVCIVLFLFFGSLALAYLLGQWLDNVALGFGIMAAFALLLLILFLGPLRGPFERAIQNQVISGFFDKEDVKENTDKHP